MAGNNNTKFRGAKIFLQLLVAVSSITQKCCRDNSDEYERLLIPENYIVESENPTIFDVGEWKILTAVLSPTNGALPMSTKHFRTLSPAHKTNFSPKTLVLLLLSCGDIHPCPGPMNFKYPCGSCAKPVKKNQHGIACDTCDSWFHVKCVDMSIEEYNRLGNSDIEWNCFYCALRSLPQFSDSLFSENDTVNESVLNMSSEDAPSPKRVETMEGIDILKNKRGFKIGHLNTGNGGLLHHLSEVTRVIENFNLDVLAISETWLDQNIDNDSVKIDGYEFNRKENNGEFNGRQGVGLYIKDHIPHNIRPDFESPLLMNLTVQINKPRCKPIIVTSLYRHPQSKVNFFPHFESLLIKLDCTKYDATIILLSFQ